MNPERLTLFFACALALLAPHPAGDLRQPASAAPHAAARAQETASRVPGEGQSPAELLRAVEGEGRNNAEAWFRLGVAQDAAGDRDAALESFRQAVKLRDDFWLARAGLAHVLYEQGKITEAEKEAAKVLPHGRFPGEAIALNTLYTIRSARQAQEAERELAQSERELARKPDDARWHLRRAAALLAAPSAAARKTLPFRSYFEERPATPPPDESTRRASREAARKLYEEAAASYEKYLRLKPNADDRAYVLGQIEALRFYAREADAQNGEQVYGMSEVNARAVILHKPDPGYTEEARKNNVDGVIRLRAVLGADGRVKHIVAVRGLPFGLTEKAVQAARNIRFKPATRNGTPVSQHVLLEYSFNVY